MFPFCDCPDEDREDSSNQLPTNRTSLLLLNPLTVMLMITVYFSGLPRTRGIVDFIIIGLMIIIIVKIKIITC